MRSKIVNIIVFSTIIVSVISFSGCENKKEDNYGVANQPNTINENALNSVANTTEKQDDNLNKTQGDNSQQSEKKQAPKAFCESDLSVKGLALGMTKEELYDLLGDPDSEENYTQKKTNYTIHDFKYDSIHLTVGLHKNSDVEGDESVDTIFYNGGDIVTRGLKVSSNYDEVKGAFLEESILLEKTYNDEKIIVVGYPNENPSYNAENKNGKLIFSIDKETNNVRSITISYGYEK